MHLQNPKHTILFISIIFVLIFLIIYRIIKSPLESFYANRNNRIKIYQSNEIFDPDEAPQYEEYDPDDKPIQFDPDQQPYLNNQLDYQILNKNKNKNKNRNKNRNNKNNISY